MSLLAVVDTNVWVSGFFWKGLPFRVLERLYGRQATACFSAETFAEWEKTLLETAERLGETDRYLVYERDVKRSAIFFQPSEHVAVCRDPKDNQFLDVAVASSAPFLVTGDKDLLSVKTFRTTRILTPRQFLDE